ncbi:MAG: hypothetical protein EXR78_06190 [Deltaproteobacteria bacterium]|nr:hypothetical protein [Deltaproteobacteria bacterium]
MYYTIIEKFGPQNHDKWASYMQWRKLPQLTSFDSVDGILRPNLFEPQSAEDWRNCVNADFKTRLITNLDYAKKIAPHFGDGDLVGVEIELEEGYAAGPGLLGFDIIDEYCDVSLLTDWGADEEAMMTPHIMPNGLLGNLAQAMAIRNTLRERFPNDAHACTCQVWAVYKIDTPPVTGAEV